MTAMFSNKGQWHRDREGETGVLTGVSSLQHRTPYPGTLTLVSDNITEKDV